METSIKTAALSKDSQRRHDAAEDDLLAYLDECDDDYDPRELGAKIDGWISTAIISDVPLRSPMFTHVSCPAAAPSLYTRAALEICRGIEAYEFHDNIIEKIRKIAAVEYHVQL